jgi:hypothetical protein
MKKFLLPAAALAVSLFLFGCSQDSPTSPAPADPAAAAAAAADKSGGHVDHGSARYEIVIENLTPATGPGASQPFSPPVVATHQRGMHIFRPGRFASEAVAQLAEDAVSGPLVEMLENSPHVQAVAMGGDVILPGGEMRLEIGASRARDRLSLVFMLVNTNDGFGGLDGVDLPRHGARTYLVNGWDAGSELNTELTSDIPGPCCGSPLMGTDEHRRIRHHRGLTGAGELDPGLYGWRGPVAKVTLRRLD